MSQSPPDFAKIGDQEKFLQPAKQEEPITHLFQYEDQSGLVQFIEQRLKVKLKLEKRNVSPKMNLILRPEIEEQLYKKCQRQFDIWQNAGPHRL